MISNVKNKMLLKSEQVKGYNFVFQKDMGRSHMNKRRENSYFPILFLKPWGWECLKHN